MMESQEEMIDWLTLHLAPELGVSSCKCLIDYFGEPKAILQATPETLKQVSGLRPSAGRALLSISKNGIKRRAESELEKVKKAGLDLITWNNELYPELLRHIHNPPIVLYLKGKLSSLQKPGIGIVGSRAATDYGKNIAYSFAHGLAQQGFAIISGLALGIDAEAHRGAIGAGGATIAVLGCGVDMQYPRENAKLYREIPEKGALLSEYPLGTPPESFRFPARNRIISGLARGVMVVEASKRSGSLITANHALEQGREVFAIPGRVDSVKSAGAHLLLQQGAKLVQKVSDIIEEFPKISMATNSTALQTEYLSKSASDVADLRSEEAVVVSVLDVYPKNIDEIIKATGLKAQKVSELLLLLELKGIIKALPGACYMRH
jgi:DNA processing protein